MPISEFAPGGDVRRRCYAACAGSGEHTSNNDYFVFDASTCSQYSAVQLQVRATTPYSLAAQIPSETSDSLQTLEWFRLRQRFGELPAHPLPFDLELYARHVVIVLVIQKIQLCKRSQDD
jgi:hypothetical protein